MGRPVQTPCVGKPTLLFGYRMWGSVHMAYSHPPNPSSQPNEVEADDGSFPNVEQQFCKQRMYTISFWLTVKRHRNTADSAVMRFMRLMPRSCGCRLCTKIHGTGRNYALCAGEMQWVSPPRLPDHANEQGKMGAEALGTLSAGQVSVG